MSIISTIGLNQLPYSIPFHPVLVHFTIALLIIAILADVIGSIAPKQKLVQGDSTQEYSAFCDLGWWNLLATAIFTAFTVLVGMYELAMAQPQQNTANRWGLSAQSTLYWHGIGGLLLFIFIVLMVVWRGKQYYGRHRGKLRPVSGSYLVVGILVTALMGVQGMLGGHLASDFAIHNTAANILWQQHSDRVPLNSVQLRLSVKDPLAPNPPSLAKPRTIQESIVFTPLNLPDPQFNQVGQTLYYGVEPLFYLTESVDWSSLLARLNQQTWNSNQFELNYSGETATITLDRQPLLQVDPSLAETWLHKLQQALL